MPTLAKVLLLNNTHSHSHIRFRIQAWAFSPTLSPQLPLALFPCLSLSLEFKFRVALNWPSRFFSFSRTIFVPFAKMSPMQFREGPTPPADCWAPRLNSERLFSELRLDSERRLTYYGGRSADTLFCSSYYLETDRGGTSPLFPLLKGSANLNPCICSEHSWDLTSLNPTQPLQINLSTAFIFILLVIPRLSAGKLVSVSYLSNFETLCISFKVSTA